MHQQLTYFYDYNCPYCYLTHVMLEQLLKKQPIQVELAAWRMPDDAVVDPKPAGYKEQGKQFASGIARELGVPIRFDSPATGTRAAQEATKIAKRMDREFEFSRELFRQKWEEGKDISNRDTILETAGRIGLNVEEFRAAFLDRQGRQAVEDDFRRSAAEKIWTIPTYAAHGRTIQIHHFKDMPSLEQLQNFIKQGESFLHEA
ncbi:DsbA family oxidoreductase [Effusibacillus pohliae]|uniref:DsbA family oxidoreductase n=1 Tax=Effusibacillus pohliae TaxID=232270 RepID=UPI0003674D9D|nr:DsbA family protein [Effusibacillus pohliae]